MLSWPSLDDMLLLAVHSHVLHAALGSRHVVMLPDSANACSQIASGSPSWVPLPVLTILELNKP
jgi:hypothetical protein